MLQAIIEEGVLTDKHMAGFVSDLVKAFESLPRKPIFWLGHRLGISRKILRLWNHFLCHTKRRFMLSGQVGSAISSNSGYPEGRGMCRNGLGECYLPQMHEGIFQSHCPLFCGQFGSHWSQLHRFAWWHCGDANNGPSSYSSN